MPNKTNSPRPPVFVHVDLDGLWTLAGVYGFDEGGAFDDDPVFKIALARMLELFAERALKAGFFIVGRDLEVESKRGAVADAIRAGHEAANHSYHHWVGLESMTEDVIRDEIGRTQQAIGELCGMAPVGFRAPGYDAGERVLKVCESLGLKYDGSWLGTPWAPALRFAANRLRRAVARETGREAGLIGFKGQYGRPHLFKSPIIRLPLAVSPVLRLPLHASLGMLIGVERVVAGWSRLLTRGGPGTLLLHGLDFLDPAEFAGRLPRALRNSRAFQIPLGAKLNLINRVLDCIQSQGLPMLARDYVTAIAEKA